MSPWSRVRAFRQQLEAGHRYCSPAIDSAGGVEADERMVPAAATKAWTAKPGSHDDGPLCGLFLGGIGAPTVGRNLDGSFTRWHVQNGYHADQTINEAFFSLRWAPASDNRNTLDGITGGYLRLADPPPDATPWTSTAPLRAGEQRREHGTPQFAREVVSLFPVMHEYYYGAQLPLEVTAEFYSPLLPESVAPAVVNGAELPVATLPVFVAEITVHNRAEYTLSVDAACFWPNLLGWKLQHSTTLDRPERSWPGQTHAGNSAHSVRDTARSAGSVAALQTRHTDRPVSDELMGEVAVYSPGPVEVSNALRNRSARKAGEVDQARLLAGRASVEACCKAQGNKIDRPPEQQGHTLAWMEEAFRVEGKLPESELSWTAHWDEALCSAVSRGDEIPAGESRCFTFVIAFDMPIVRFGDGRRWYRNYTAAFGTHGRHAMQIARYAAEQHENWRAAIDEWQRSVLAARERRIAGAMLNELYFINGGGSVWVHRWAQELDVDIPAPLLGADEHCAVLEGYDIGYYYYNTSDLWPYAWYAIWRWWPSFARNVFSDLLSTVPLEIPHKQMIYRSETMEPLLVAGKIPHDIGAVMEDPWHRLNGYQMRDDSNLWKDHNPAFILSFYLERWLAGTAGTLGTGAAEHMGLSELTEKGWASLRQAGMFMLTQAEADTALPLHQSFGDSTWDNLGIRGYASYSAGFTLGSLAALAVLAEQFYDHELATAARRRLALAQTSFVEHLWNGEYYRICDRGKYADCLMGDGILGIFMADLAGLGEILDAIPRDSLRSHLEACYRYSFLQYCNGSVGPLLVAAPGKTRFSGDGGDELQVNEVLLGSAWACVAMMEHYGLEREAHEIAEVLVDRVYAPEHNGCGLQFRTPAAMDGEGRFRAPMNMRPLSIWFLDAVRRLRSDIG